MSTPIFKDFDAVRAFLADTTDYEKMVRFRMKRGAFDLGRVERFFDAIEAPQTAYEIVHIAGTTGKGSTAIACDAVLRAHGLSTGRFTSPHIERETERITINDEEITYDELLACFNEMGDALKRFQRSGDALTYFEIMTAAALVAFRRAGIDVAVLETGLGGRLDATNAVMPAVTVITTIGHDHLDKLGETLADVAYEKAGIIKPTIPLITGSYDHEALEVVLARARNEEAPVRRLESDYGARNVQPHAEGITFDLYGKGYEFNKCFAPVLSSVFAVNAAMAVEVAQHLDQAGIIERVEEDKIKQAFAGIRTPGRCERFVISGKDEGAPITVILDTAHNPESMHQSVKTLRQRRDHRKVVMLFGIAQDKEIELVLQELTGRIDRAVFSGYDSVRATSPEDLGVKWRKFGGDIAGQTERSAEGFERALKLSLEFQPPAIVLITGSFYLAGEVRPILRAYADQYAQRARRFGIENS